jgi:lysophospholipase L1-like esterase
MGKLHLSAACDCALTGICSPRSSAQALADTPGEVQVIPALSSRIGRGPQLVLLVVLLALSFGGSVGARSASVRARAAVETVTVPSTTGVAVTSQTVLDPTHAYEITASGTVSDWCPPTATDASQCSYGSPLSLAAGVDPLYCYATWRCPTPALWRQLTFNNLGLDEISNLTGAIPYSADHTYRAEVTGVTGPLSLLSADSPSDDSGSFVVTIEDKGPVGTLVVGLGDSMASGEGNPDKPRSGFHRTVWQDVRCDRSNRSFQARVARDLGASDPKKPVTFINLACSGASIEHGLLGPYAGINPPSGGSDLPAQVDEARRLAAGRKVDVVLITAGVNDLRFGDVLKFCATTRGECMDKEYRDGQTLRAWMNHEMLLMHQRYDDLAAALKTLAPDGAVFITQYPQLLRDENGNLCTSMLNLRASEIKWLNDHFYLPLNKQIRHAAGRNTMQWHLIDGAPSAFNQGGYCATRHRLIVWAKESLNNQGDVNGAMHPNRDGHAVLEKLLYPVVHNYIETHKH